MSIFCFFFFNDTATTEIYTLSLHDALPISRQRQVGSAVVGPAHGNGELRQVHRSEEHTSELQSQSNLVCRLLLEKKKTSIGQITSDAASGLRTLETNSVRRRVITCSLAYIT